MTARDAIRAYAEQKGESVTYRELVDALHLHGETVRRTIYRMIDSKELEAAGDGGYVLPEAKATGAENSDQNGERDTSVVTPDPSSVTPEAKSVTPGYTGGLGVYDPSAPGGVRPWRPKAGA